MKNYHWNWDSFGGLQNYVKHWTVEGKLDRILQEIWILGPSTHNSISSNISASFFLPAFLHVIREPVI